MVHAKIKRLNITGNVAVTTVRRTPAGSNITLKVGDDANEELGQHGYHIFISAAGLTELIDPRKDKKAGTGEDWQTTSGSWRRSCRR